VALTCGTRRAAPPQPSADGRRAVPLPRKRNGNAALPQGSAPVAACWASEGRVVDRICPAADARAGRLRQPVGTVNVADTISLNRLYITYNRVEELVRLTLGGKTRAAAMRAYKWRSPLVLNVRLRPGNRFRPAALTAGSVRQAFEEQQRWQAPHPPNTHFNVDKRIPLQVLGPHRLAGRAAAKVNLNHSRSCGIVPQSSTVAPLVVHLAVDSVGSSVDGNST